MAGYARTPGNRGVWMLRRDVDDRTEFVMFTLWDSLEAVKAFAGDDYETAVFYPEDERFLVERELTAAHYEVDTHAGPEHGMTATGSCSGTPWCGHAGGWRTPRSARPSRPPRPRP